MKFQELYETQQGEAPRTPSLSQGVFLRRQVEKRAHIFKQAESFETANELFSFGFHKVTDPHLRERWTACFFDLLDELRDRPGQERQAEAPEEPRARASFPQPLSGKRKHISIELD